MMFNEEKRFGTNLKAVANGSTIFAFGKQKYEESGSHVGPGAYYSTTKENIRYGTVCLCGFLVPRTYSNILPIHSVLL